MTTWGPGGGGGGGGGGGQNKMGNLQISSQCWLMINGMEIWGGGGGSINFEIWRGPAVAPSAPWFLRL